MENNDVYHKILAAVQRADSIFPSSINKNESRNYILVMFFLKYLSDASDEAPQFNIPEDANFYALHKNRNEANIGDLINSSLDKIQKANSDLLGEMFRYIDYNSESNFGDIKNRNTILKNLLDAFLKSELDFKKQHVDIETIGQCYSRLIKIFSPYTRKFGFFCTPERVCNLITELASPEKNDTICDPACGSGGLLISMANAVDADKKNIHGKEINGSIWLLAKMNMILHGMSNAKIECGDTLSDVGFSATNQSNIKFDIMVSTPSFSKMWQNKSNEINLFNPSLQGDYSEIREDYAFIMHMIESAKPKSGKIYVVAGEQALIANGAEREIRQSWIENNLLDAVIKIPERIFPRTATSFFILIFDRSREEGGKNSDRGDVMFIDFTTIDDRTSLSDEQVSKILCAYKERNTNQNFTRLVGVDEIKRNLFDISISFYLTNFVSDIKNTDALQKEIIELQDEFNDIQNKLSILTNGMKKND